MSIPLETVFARATDAHRDEGELWYQVAHEAAYDLARAYGLTIDQGAGIIAALSPRCRWEDNVLAASEVAAGEWPRRILPANVYKARRILEGEDPDDVLGGNKVRAFYANILSEGTDRNVTVDTHAVSAYYGTPLGSMGIGNPLYREVSEAYQDLADRHGMTPPQAQATVWVAWRDGVRAW